ncbi:hypothetical protein TNCV_2088911 [Trichonephila clavipes]|nr:hypothetical protein TNCV_2088911 [Trichonephila clavipes]
MIQYGIHDTNCARGSLVVKVTDSWPACQGFEPCTAEDPLCRETMEIKSVEAQTSSRWCGSGFKTNKIPTNSVEKCDPVTGQWSYVTPMRASRVDLKVASLGRCIYAMGGIEKMTKQNVAETYDVDENRWEDGPEMLSSSIGAEAIKCPPNLNGIIRFKNLLEHKYEDA